MFYGGMVFQKWKLIVPSGSLEGRFLFSPSQTWKTLGSIIIIVIILLQQEIYFRVLFLSELET